MCAAYVLMFESASNMDAGLPEDERHWVEEVEAALHPLDDDDEMPDEGQQLADVEAMRQMANRVNAVWGGES